MFVCFLHTLFSDFDMVSKTKKCLEFTFFFNFRGPSPPQCHHSLRVAYVVGPLFDANNETKQQP